MRSILFIIFIYFFCGVAYLHTFYHIDLMECVPIKTFETPFSPHEKKTRKQKSFHDRVKEQVDHFEPFMVCVCILFYQFHGCRTVGVIISSLGFSHFSF